MTEQDERTLDAITSIAEHSQAIGLLVESLHPDSFSGDPRVVALAVRGALCLQTITGVLSSKITPSAK